MKYKPERQRERERECVWLIGMDEIGILSALSVGWIRWYSELRSFCWLLCKGRVDGGDVRSVG